MEVVKAYNTGEYDCISIQLSDEEKKQLLSIVPIFKNILKLQDVYGQTDVFEINVNNNKIHILPEEMDDVISIIRMMTYEEGK